MAAGFTAFTSSWEPFYISCFCLASSSNIWPLIPNYSCMCLRTDVVNKLLPCFDLSVSVYDRSRVLIHFYLLTLLYLISWDSHWALWSRAEWWIRGRRWQRGRRSSSRQRCTSCPRLHMTPPSWRRTPCWTPSLDPPAMTRTHCCHGCPSLGWLAGAGLGVRARQRTWRQDTGSGQWMWTWIIWTEKLNVSLSFQVTQAVFTVMHLCDLFRRMF